MSDYLEQTLTIRTLQTEDLTIKVTMGSSSDWVGELNLREAIVKSCSILNLLLSFYSEVGNWFSIYFHIRYNDKLLETCISYLCISNISNLFIWISPSVFFLDLSLIIEEYLL